jgi:hypothetical protein
MSSFLKYLNQQYPQSSKCEVCGGNPYTCHCDDTPNIDMGMIVSMYHPINHKRQTVEYKSVKYRALIACGWVELAS